MMKRFLSRFLVLALLCPLLASACSFQAGISPDCSVRNTLISHYYVASEDKTYFICQFDWEWTAPPSHRLTDSIAMDWNNDFTMDSSVDEAYNVCHVTYVNPRNSQETEEVSLPLSQALETGAQAQLPMRDPDTGFYAKSGTGYLCLSQRGQVCNAKFSFHYQHTTLRAVPYLQLLQFMPLIHRSWFIKSEIQEGEALYRPLEIVNSSRPAVC